MKEISLFDRVKRRMGQFPLRKKVEADEKHAGSGERKRHDPHRVFMRVAAAVLVLGILAASPQVRFSPFVSAAGNWLGHLVGIQSERSSDGFEIVDYGYEYVALRKTISSLNQTVTMGDFEFTFQNLLYHDYLSGENVADLSSVAVPVRVAFKGDKEKYGEFLPPYEMKFNIIGYKENKRVIELSFTYQGLFHEVGDEMYPAMSDTKYYPTKFINGKPSPTNQYLTVYYGRIIYMDTELLANHYQQYVQALYDANELFFGHEDYGSLGYYFDGYSDGTEDDTDETNMLANWNNGTKELYQQWIKECDSMSKAERKELKEQFDDSLAFALSPDGWGYYDVGLEGFREYNIICALTPDRYEITTAELSTYTATDYDVIKSRSYNAKRDTVYDSFVNRFVVKWKNRGKANCRVVNREYFNRVKKENPEAAEKLSHYTPVAFRSMG